MALKQFNPTEMDPIDVMEEGAVGLKGMPSNMGIFDNSDGQGVDQWAGYFGSIERLAARNNQTYFSFVDSAHLDDRTPKAYVDTMLNLATWEMDAYCYNRLDHLKELRLQLQHILVYCKQPGLGDRTDFMWLDAFKLMLPVIVPEDTIKALPHGRDLVESLIAQIGDLQDNIRYDRRVGSFRDYGLYKRIYLTAGQEEADRKSDANPDIHAPRFLRRVSEFCATESAGFREPHIESMLAKVVALREGIAQIMMGPRRGRGRGRSQGDSDMNSQDNGGIDA